MTEFNQFHSVWSLYVALDSQGKNLEQVYCFPLAVTMTAKHLSIQ